MFYKIVKILDLLYKLIKRFTIKYLCTECSLDDLGNVPNRKTGKKKNPEFEELILFTKIIFPHPK